jgi:hypothetical protein
MSKLTTQIESRRQKAAELRHQADMLEAEARGMELAARYSEPRTSTAKDAIKETLADIGSAPDHVEAIVGRRGGRQRGAISPTWREILAELREHHPAGFDENDVQASAAMRGIKLRSRDARYRMRHYVTTGLVRENNGRCSVPAEAMAKLMVAA